MEPNKPEERTDPDGLTAARSAIDATVAELDEETNLDHWELADMLLETRDALLINERVPEWWGDADAGRYAAMVRR